MTVLRLSRGMACRPRLVAAINALISGGTDVRFSGMTSPFFSGGAAPRGSNATYCSPIAVWL